MKAAPLAIALASSLAVAAPAAAGGYISAGIGADAVLTGGLDDEFDAEATGSGRLALGLRTGPVAVEASAFGAPFANAEPMGGEREPAGDFAPFSLGVDLKYHVSLFPKLEAYGRAGVHRTWVVQNGASTDEIYSGRGHALGGGVQLPVDAFSTVDAAFWLDYTRQTTQLAMEGGGSLIEGNAHMVMLGVAFGSGV